MRIKTLILMAMLGFSLAACNTVAGVGEDISAAGRGLSGTAETTKDKIN